MKHLIKTIIFSVAVAFIQQGVLAAEPVNIGVLDLQRCIQESNEGKRIAESLKNKEAEIQKNLSAKQQELLNMREDMEKQSLMLSMDAKTEREKEFEKKRRDLNYLVQDLSEEMKQAEADARIHILNILSGVVETIATQQKLDMIAERANGGILYFSKELDITGQVIAELNRVKP
ncbi:MAG: OmpH family outer membrane protein [Deltaproteobacteria bacterium]|nr:OmpH family outer membrane protein [Deltaproteobacteria bacterium]